MIDLSKAKPREVEAYLREAIRKSLGDAVENGSSIYAKNGYYTVRFDLGGAFVAFNNFRKTEAKKIAKAIRALKG